MSVVKNEIVVLDIAGSHARIVCDKSAAESDLIALGFFINGDQMVRPISDIADRKKLLFHSLS